MSSNGFQGGKKFYVSLALVLTVCSGFLGDFGIENYLKANSVSTTVSLSILPAPAPAAPLILNPVSSVASSSYTLHVQSVYMASIYLNDSLVGVVNSADGIIDVLVQLPDPVNIFTLQAVDYFGTSSSFLQFTINNGTSISQVSGAPSPGEPREINDTETSTTTTTEIITTDPSDTEEIVETVEIDATVSSTNPVVNPVSADFSSIFTPTSEILGQEAVASTIVEDVYLDSSIESLVTVEVPVVQVEDAEITVNNETTLEVEDDVEVVNLFKEGIDGGEIFTENKFQTFGHTDPNTDVQIYLVSPDGIEVYIGDVKTDAKGDYFFTGVFPGEGTYQVLAKYLDGKGNAIASNDKKTISYADVPPTPLDISGFSYLQANVFNAFWIISLF